MKFGTRLKELREELKMTQEELSKALGTGKASICHYEKNRRLPDTLMIEKCADYFDVTIDYILGKSDIREKYNEKKDGKMTLKEKEFIVDELINIMIEQKAIYDDESFSPEKFEKLKKMLELAINMARIDI
jgi:transcriptional regulator with XRE-family HTH domain